MPVIILYLLKLSICLSVVWLFYQVLLRRLTFYNLNRWYLLFYSLISFFIPLIDIAPMVGNREEAQPIVVRLIPAIVDNTPVVAVAPAVRSDHGVMPDGWSLLLGVILLGSMILLAKLMISWMALRRMRRRSKPLEYGGTRVYHVDASIAPFSFGNAVFINKTLHTDGELEEILAHERVHIRQKHTADILLAEIFLIVNWYNPFIWLIRHAIRQNLEFIADRQVLAGGLDRKSYQYHLLKVVGEPVYQLANNFNFSSLKKRIVMMNRIQSTRMHLVKFLFILPLMGVLLVSFRGRVSGLLGADGSPALNIAGIVTDDQTLQPLEGVTVSDITSGLSAVTDIRGFYKLHIPAGNKSVLLSLQTHKEGYATNKYGYLIGRLDQSRGLIYLQTLHRANDPRPGMSLDVPMGQKFPVDPAYEDAEATLDGARTQAVEEAKNFRNAERPDTSRKLPDPSVIGIGVNDGKIQISSSTGKKEGAPPLLFVIDGVPGKFDPGVLTPQSVYSVDVLSAEKSLALYPDKCNKCVVLEFTTRPNRERRDDSKWGPYFSRGSVTSDQNKVLLYYH